MTLEDARRIIAAARAGSKELRDQVLADFAQVRVEHEIAKRENRATLAAAMREWLNRAFGVTEPLVEVS